MSQGIWGLLLWEISPPAGERISGRPPKARHLCVIPGMLWTQPGRDAQMLAHFGLVSPPANVEQGGAVRKAWLGLLVGMGALSTVSGRAPAQRANPHCAQPRKTRFLCVCGGKVDEGATE